MKMMNKQRLSQAKKLAQQPYTTIVAQDELTDGTIVFVAHNPELEGCMADGATEAEAVASLYDARVDFIYFLLEDGLPVPPPATENISLVKR